jgi:hypothetical protein
MLSIFGISSVSEIVEVVSGWRFCGCRMLHVTEGDKLLVFEHQSCHLCKRSRYFDIVDALQLDLALQSTGEAEVAHG